MSLRYRKSETTMACSECGAPADFRSICLACCFKSSPGIKGDLKRFLAEYVREAEHQDGEMFWANFETVGDLLGDMVRYSSDGFTDQIPRHPHDPHHDETEENL